MANNRFIYTSKGALLDIERLDSVIIDGKSITYKASRFNKEVTDTIVAEANAVADVAVLILNKVIKGQLLFTYGHVAKGAYPEALTRHGGNNSVLSSIWINTDEETMVRWWSREKGVSRKVLNIKKA